METVSRIVCSLILAGYVISTPFSPCPIGNGSFYPAPNSVDIPGCQTDNCSFIRGQTYVFSEQETAEVNTSSLRLQLNIYYTDRPTEMFPVPEDGCTRLTMGNCPIDETENFTYSRNITVVPSNETVVVTSEFILYGDNNQTVTCFRIINTAIGA